MGKHKTAATQQDPTYGIDVSTPEGQAAWDAKHASKSAFDLHMQQAFWDDYQKNPAYQAFADREMAAAGYSRDELKQRMDMNNADNASRAAGYKSNERIASGNNKTSYQIAQMNAANDQQKTALQAAQVAADLSSRPDDYWKANAFYNGIQHTQIPNWLTGLVQGMPNVAWSPPAVTPQMVAQSPVTPNTAMDGSAVAMPVVSGDTSGGSTGTGTAAPIAGQNTAQTVASTAPVNGTPVASFTQPQAGGMNTTPQAGSIQYTNQLMNGQAIPAGAASLPWINAAANAPQKLLPGSIESMDPTRKALFLAGINATGHDAPSFLNSYNSYALNQSAPNRFTLGQEY